MTKIQKIIVKTRGSMFVRTLFSSPIPNSEENSKKRPFGHLPKVEQPT